MSLGLWEYFWTESDWGAAVGPAVGSLLLLGVGRAWWLPWVVWTSLAGHAEAGPALGAVWTWWEAVALIAGGALGTWALALARARRRRRATDRLLSDASSRCSRLEEELARHRPVIGPDFAGVAGVIRGASHSRVCAACGQESCDGVERYDGTFLCARHTVGESHA